MILKGDQIDCPFLLPLAHLSFLLIFPAIFAKFVSCKMCKTALKAMSFRALILQNAVCGAFTFCLKALRGTIPPQTSTTF